jgi:hypothetical protein
MKPFFLSILIGAIALFQPAITRADEASHRKAAESLLSLMNMDAVMSQSIDQMLQMQIKQNPAIAPHEQEMKSFLKKYMSWAGLKDDMVKIYVDEFTESELDELNKFYQTPLGKRPCRECRRCCPRARNSVSAACRNICLNCRPPSPQRRKPRAKR